MVRIMSNVIEFAIGFDDIEQVLELSELLSNTAELIEKFEPTVSRYLVKKGFFKGRALIEYNKQFDELIKTLIKKEIMSHFPSWTPEDILSLTEDTEFLRMLGQDLFDQEKYRIAKMN